MKQDIHPTYYPAAKVKCACGNKFETGSTMPEIEVEICSSCHPFFTGKEKIIDAQGRIEKFRKRQEKITEKKSELKTRGKKSPKSKETKEKKK